VSGSCFLGKKGIDIQFNWIFVLIAGAILLGFFFSLINNTLKQGTDDMSQQSQQDLRFLLKTSESSRQTEKTMPFTKKIIFSCDGVSEYYIQGFSQHYRYDYNVIFSPPSLDGKEILVKTDSLQAPQTVMPFVYLTNKDVEYVFMGSDPILLQLYSSMPKNTTRRMITDGSQTPDKNYDRTIFITADPAGPDDAWLSFSPKAGRVFAVQITAVGGVLNGYGNVTFYTHDGSGFAPVAGGVKPYFGEQMLLGAIVSGDAQIFECQALKSLRRLNMLANLTKMRLDNLSLSQSAVCTSKYLLVDNDLQDIASFSRAGIPSFQDMGFIMIAANDIAAKNIEILDTTSCVPVY
jgi:hypothetical protein